MAIFSSSWFSSGGRFRKRAVSDLINGRYWRISWSAARGCRLGLLNLADDLVFLIHRQNLPFPIEYE